MAKAWNAEDGKALALLKLSLQASPSAMHILYIWPSKARFHEPAHQARVAGWDVKVRESA